MTTPKDPLARLEVKLLCDWHLDEKFIRKILALIAEVRAWRQMRDTMHANTGQLGLRLDHLGEADAARKATDESLGKT